jgi:hypothetical protein
METDIYPSFRDLIHQRLQQDVRANTTRDDVTHFSSGIGAISYDNSLTVIVGNQGAGKTTLACEDILSIALGPGANLVFLVLRKAYDKTIDATIRTLEDNGIQVETSTWDEPEKITEKLKKIIDAKRKYYDLLKHADSRGVSRCSIPDHLSGPDTELLARLNVSDYKADSLRSILLLDDTGKNALLKEGSLLSNMVKILRELNFIVLILCHSWTDLAPSFKSNASIVVICKGFSPERLYQIYRTVNVNVDWRDFKELYENMDARYLVCDSRSGGMSMEG